MKIFAVLRHFFLCLKKKVIADCYENIHIASATQRNLHKINKKHFTYI